MTARLDLLWLMLEIITPQVTRSFPEIQCLSVWCLIMTKWHDSPFFVKKKGIKMVDHKNGFTMDVLGYMYLSDNRMYLIFLFFFLLVLGRIK